jgi:hypothetical protein
VLEQQAREGHWNNKMVAQRMPDGNWLASSESMLVDFQRSDFGVKRGLWNAQAGRRSGGPRHLAVTLGECCLDQLSLLGSESVREVLNRRTTRACTSPDPTFIHRQVLGIAHDDGSFDYVLQLPNVAWPRVQLKQIEASPIDSGDPLAGFAGVSIHKVLDQKRDVLFSLTKRRHFDREHVQAVEQILAKPSRRDCLP